MITNGGRLALLPHGPPLLQVVVDTEEEFDWERPFDRRNVSVTAIDAQCLAQAIYAPYGLRPTYVLDYPVATSRSAASVLKAFQDAGQCQVGAHLHPWVNPPFDEEIGDFNSYPGNLPATLKSAKLRALTDAIQAAFGRRPTIYKAGRYGVGAHTAAILAELGYRIDLSVVPHTDFRRQFGPDFRGCPDRPYWFAENMLELPLSRGFSGLAARFGAMLHRPHRARLGSPSPSWSSAVEGQPIGAGNRDPRGRHVRRNRAAGAVYATARPPAIHADLSQSIACSRPYTLCADRPRRFIVP